MAKRTVAEIVTELAIPIAERHGFELVDVEFVKEGANWYLRVYIDKPGGITLDDCQAASEELSDELDRTNPIRQQYFLEVSSPGLERPLKTDRDFERFKGTMVEVRFYEHVDGMKAVEGELVGLIDGKVAVKTDRNTVASFARDKISLVKRIARI